MPEKSSPQDKIIAVVGPTSSGKSELAAKLAKRFKGEVVSCDSRQIYKDMDLGTGKVEGRWQVLKVNGYQKRMYVYKGVIHHLIDFVDPKKQYSVATFQKQAQKIIGDILKRRRLPILCGGTGHWVDAVAYGQHLPEVKPNLKLRAKLEKETADELYEKLMKLDPARAKTIDRHNRRRLIRALEIVMTTGKPVPQLLPSAFPLSPFDTLWLGLTLPRPELYKKIEKRLKQRFKQGLVKEVKRLHRQGLSYKRLEDFGLTYKFVSMFLQGKIDEEEMFKQSLLSEQRYTKRQETWFKRNKDINWIKDYPHARKYVAGFLK